MKDWDKLTPDITKLMNCHFTAGRGGHAITKIVIHENAGSLTVQQCWNVWQTREASAHYQVQADGLIGRLVIDSDTAWHAGDWVTNQTSIGVEHANKPDGTVTAETLDAGAHLVAALCKKYSLGRPQWGLNVFPHKTYQATACPQQLYGTQKTAYIEAAQAYYDAMTGATTTGKSNDEIASEVIAGKWGNGADRKTRLTAAGYDYAAIQALVNQRLTGSGSARPASTRKSNDEIATEVIAGKWGNGADRKTRLTAAGYDYAAIQALVNRRLA